MSFLRFLILFSFLAVLWSGCSTAEKADVSTPDGAFKVAEEYEKDDRYEEAIQKFQDVKNKFPYSRFATQAELRVADLQYKREAYIESQSAYQLFKDFHPKHPQIAYVTFRLAMSYYNQLPSTTDRDLTLADKAILYFSEVINSYPTSEYVTEAKAKKEESLHMLADKEMYIARFYVKQEQCDSALKRFAFVLKTYPNLGFDPAALFGAARCAFETGEKERGVQYEKSLISLYPNSDEAKRAPSEFARYGTN
jgi:outer membrane protein assembly factor BamD